ncbi:hypothetical protein SLA2020_286100 [Shorea laevis]
MVDEMKQNPETPNFLSSVTLKYVKLGYHYFISNAMYLLVVPLLGITSAHLSTFTGRNFVQFDPVSVTLCSTLMVSWPPFTL